MSERKQGRINIIEHGITNDPVPWSCICGERFQNIEQAFLHGFAAGQDSMDPSEIKSVTGISPRCDICGRAQQPEDDWNGDTGNHVACEQAEET